MDQAETNDSSYALRVGLSVPTDERFRETVSALCVEFAAHAGSPREQASDIGRAVGEALAYAHGHCATGQCELHLSANQETLHIDLSYQINQPAAVKPGGESDGDGLPSDGGFALIRRVMDTVERHTTGELADVPLQPPLAARSINLMRLYNTLTRSDEKFAPVRGREVRMYTCGLTVYARGHIGNFRTFIALDVLRRALRHLCGYEVRQVMNFTDVDDRTIAESQNAGVALREYTDKYVAAFLEDAATLGIEPPEEMPRATDEANLRAMCDLIAELEKRGHTYRSDGSIYFKISTLPEYGKLARLDHEGIQPGARIDSDRYDKQDARDFVLWKATKPGEPTWDFGVGPGRPGWHIECSAMALRLLGGPPIDIHAGGVDLIFPHHENEIAQSEGATGQQFSRFWVHTEHLLVDAGEKMSKSLGNVFTVNDVIDRGYRASSMRYLLLSVHYRKQLRFTWASLAQADTALQRITDFLARLDTLRASDAHPEVAERLQTAQTEFRDMLMADLNTAGGLGVVFELVRTLNAAIDAGGIGAGDAPAIRAVFDEFDQVLGVLSLRRKEDAQPPIPSDEIDRMLEERQAARRRRDFAAADEIRRRLESRGIVLEDSAAGTRWKRK